MHLVLFCLVSLLSANAIAGFWSPPSTVDGVKISNFHYVMRLPGRFGGELYRGAQPMGRENEALGIGITDVLILKNEMWNEVKNEQKRWLGLGYADFNIHHLPVRWRNSDEETACLEMMDALQFASDVFKAPNSKLFIHCTAGEDRTGVFVGLMQMLHSGMSVSEAFQDMCANGYAEANRWKPRPIVRQVQTGLTPMFSKFATWIQRGELRWNRIDPDLCRDIGATYPALPPETMRCR